MSRINFCRTILILLVGSFVSLNTYAQEVWKFYSNVASDRDKWSNHGTYPDGGGAMIAVMANNTHVFVWANEDFWSSAGRTVTVPDLYLGICQASIEHTGKNGTFYVRNSGSYTKLTTPVNTNGDGYTALTSDKLYWTDVVTPNFFADNKKIFARFVFSEGRTYHPLYHSSGPAASLIDDLRITCI